MGTSSIEHKALASHILHAINDFMEMTQPTRSKHVAYTCQNGIGSDRKVKLWVYDKGIVRK